MTTTTPTLPKHISDEFDGLKYSCNPLRKPTDPFTKGIETLEAFNDGVEAARDLFAQTLETEVQKAVENKCSIPWMAVIHDSGWGEDNLYFKSEDDARRWLVNKYQEVKADPDRYTDGTFKWQNKEKTSFQAKMSVCCSNENGTEYDEMFVYYSVKPMEFEPLSHKENA